MLADRHPDAGAVTDAILVYIAIVVTLIYFEDWE